MATKIKQYHGIKPLQPKPGLETRENLKGWEKLRLSAQHVNRVALELETAILEFKAIASNIKSIKTVDAAKSKHIVVYASVSVPWILQKPNQSLILTTRKIDLFRAERDAANLAESLRLQNRRKARQK